MRCVVLQGRDTRLLPLDAFCVNARITVSDARNLAIAPMSLLNESAMRDASGVNPAPPVMAARGGFT